MIVIDASATIALLLNEDNELAEAEQLLALINEPTVAPSHWVAEVSNALVINVRRRRLDPMQFDQMTERLRTLGITIDPPPSFPEIATIAHQAIEAELTYYDAAYVHKALIKQASLFTFDRRMREAAMRLKIPVLPQ